MKRVLQSFFLIINYKTLIITVLAVISTYICSQNNINARFPDMLVGVAIVFPVVFSISSAYTRRETALQRLSDFKGHAVAIYFASRDWTTDKNNKLPEQTRALVNSLTRCMRDMFTRYHRQEWEKYEHEAYRLFSELSTHIMEFRNYGVQSSEVSRLNQYASKMIIAFDNLKVIHAYRTPITLRAYSKVFIYIFPIIYGPYFAATAMDYSPGLQYVMPVLYSFILVSLDNIQDHLEHPFDEVGEDDIRIDEQEMISVMH
ncbi:MAG: hypothetical protein KF845_06575 [Cyclobacteriaceae bacterium]|nr:hypothetical protein [Cyclobacteriaceae bacterium]